MLCPGLLQDFFYLRVFLVCGTSGIPLIKKSISCHGVDVTKMNVFFTNVFWDNYGLHTSLQEDVKMSDLLLFLKCFSESWHCYLLSRRCQVTIFNFYFGVWRKVGFTQLDGWIIQSSSFSLCFPFILFWLLQGFCKYWTILIWSHEDFKMYLAWRWGPGMPVAVHILTSKTSSPQISPRKCSLSWLTAGWGCWWGEGESWEDTRE